MKTENGHIVEATMEELRSLWLHYEVYELMPFNEYVENFRRSGAHIIDDKE